MAVEEVKEQADLTKESQEAVSETEQKNEVSESQAEAVSDEKVEGEDKAQETPEIDLENPKIKAAIEALVEKKAQSLKDKRVQKLIDEMAAKQREAEDLKTRMEAEKSEIVKEAQFKATLEAERKKLEAQGVPDDVIERFEKEKIELHKWAMEKQKLADLLEKDRKEVSEIKLKYHCQKLATEYGLSEKDVEDMVATGDETKAENLALKKLIAKQNKPAPKPKTEQKLDSGKASGSGDVFTREQIARMSPTEYAKKRDKIYEALEAGKVK